MHYVYSFCSHNLKICSKKETDQVILIIQDFAKKCTVEMLPHLDFDVLKNRLNLLYTHTGQLVFKCYFNVYRNQTYERKDCNTLSYIFFTLKYIGSTSSSSSRVYSALLCNNDDKQSEML